jgi:diadenosine tetraphosphatase ApaH/serine/threonine PP2A family protein phosphatase
VHYLILSDVHANLTALEAVLADAPDFDEIWCLGDLVGYGPNPNECVERIQDFDHISLAGNHDLAALGRLDIRSFNTDARLANAWTQSELTPAVREYLSELPPQMEKDDFYLAHASPREPVWEYILDASLAYANFAYFSAAICLVGHTHVPIIFELDEQQRRCETTVAPFPESVSLGPRRMIINPGSVGQPRDGNPDAAYAIFDSEQQSIRLHRIPYDISATQKKMQAHGLPVRLAARLSYGV